MLVSEGLRDDEVVQDLARLEAVALGGNLTHAVGAEAILRVYHDHLARPTPIVTPQLSSDGQGADQLRLARAELAKDLGNGARLVAAPQQGIELFAPRSDLDAALKL